jgi:hypothetical protein
MGALGLGKSHLEAKAKLKQTKVESEARVVEKASDNIADWEQIHARGSNTSWKDEFWTVVWSIPVIMCFLPGGAERAQAGFDGLKTMPEWYIYVLVTIVLASFGIRFGGKLKDAVQSWRGTNT